MSASEGHCLETVDISEDNDLMISHDFSSLKCLVCFGDLDKRVVRPLSVSQKVFNSCSKNLHSVITKETLSGKWDYHKQKHLPFCQDCFENGHELTQLTDQLEKIQKKVSDLILSFSLTILNRRSQAVSPEDVNEQYNYKNKLENDIMEHYSSNDKPVDENQSSEDDFQSLYKYNNGTENDEEVESMEVKCELPYDLQDEYNENQDYEEVEEEEETCDDYATGDDDTYDNSSHGEYSYQQQQQPAAGSSSGLENGMSRIKRIIQEKYQTQNPQIKIQKLKYKQDGSVVVPKDEPNVAAPIRAKLQNQKSLQIYRSQMTKLRAKMNNDYGHLNYRRNTNAAGNSTMSSISSIVKNLNVVSSQNRKILPKQTQLNAQLYKCRYCFQSFRQIQLLEKHERTHTKPEKHPFKCPKCSKRFKSQSNVNSHLLTHSGQKSFTCDYCSYATYWVSNLKTHQRTHTGEMPYKCRECSIRFKTYQVGVNHYKKFHPEHEFTKGCLLFESNLSELDLVCL